MNQYLELKIKIRNNGKLKANADLILHCPDNETIVIKNYQIWESTLYNHRLKDYVNIAPPSYRLGGKNYPIVFFEKATHWEKIEKLIWEKYQTELANSAPINIPDNFGEI